MCNLKLYLCAEHRYSVHGVKIYRCRAAIAHGLPRISNITRVRVLHLTQDEGCSGFEFSIGPHIMTTCPFSDAGGRIADPV